MSNPQKNPGLSWRSVGLGLCGLCFCGWIVSTATGPLGWQRAAGAGALAMGALSFLGLVLLGDALSKRLCRFPLLSKSELLCLVYLLLAGAPFMGLGFWVPAIQTAGGPEKRAAWTVFDLFPDQFRAIGPNLVGPERMDLAKRADVRDGELVTDGEGDRQVLELRAEGAEGAWVRLPLDLVEDGLYHNARYLFTARFRFEGDSGTVWSARLVPANGPGSPIELARGRGPSEPSQSDLEGFTRDGNFGFSLPSGADERVFLEIRTDGPGMLEMTDPQLTEVTAITQFFEGRPLVGESEYNALPENSRAGVAVRPDDLFSFAGLKYLLGGRIPWEFWTRPITAWLIFHLLLFGGTFAIAIIMRRQWLDRERFPMPLTYPVVDLIGRPETPRRMVPAVFRNGLFRVGFGIGALYALAAIAFAFNPGLPNPQPTIAMHSYFTGDWGDTWKFAFEIIPLVFAIGLLLDLNITLSVVIGFFLFRLQHWIGAQTGWAADSRFPYESQQFGGAVLAYGLTLLYFARRHIVNSMKVAVRGERRTHRLETAEANDPSEDDTGDDRPFGYRFGYGLLLVSAFGFLAWAGWLGLGWVGALVIFAILLLLAFVLMRVRAECGLPFAIIGSPTSALVLVPVAGGLGFLGAEAFGMNHILGGAVFGTTILVVAGLQVEFLELARRYGLRRWHVPATLILAIVGGVVIGGWFFLSAHYSVGSDNVQHATQYDIRPAKINDMAQPLATARRIAAGEDASTAGDAAGTAFFFSGGVMAALTALRQLFAGFWFHPVGFLLGPYMAPLWGGLLLAWLVRLLVVKLGGAATVREKLRPFAVGIIVALALFYTIGFAANLYVAHTSPGQDLFFWRMSPNR